MLLSALPTGLGPAAPVPAPLPDEVLVTVGEVGPDHASLWLRGPDGSPIHVTLAPAGAGGATHETDALPDPDRDLTARLELSRLEPGRRYAYEASQAGRVVAGEFSTAPPPRADVAVHLAWSGDLGGAGHCRDVEDGYRIFDVLRARRPDLFLFVGDTIYADHVCGQRPHVPGYDFVAATLDGFWTKHRYNRADPAVQRFFRTAAVFPTWDDHEVRNNFVGSRDPLMAAGRQAFFDYWPVSGPPDEPQRLYRSVRWGRHVEIFMLDTRQYRSANWAVDGESKTMLGEAQRRWLLEGVAASDATWKLVVSSVPLGYFTGGGAADGWSSANVLGFPRRNGAGFRHERDLILDTFRRHGAANVVFLITDVHHGELIRHAPFPDWTFHEFLAGPLAARQGYPHPLDRSLHSRSLGSLGWSYNFGEIVADGGSLEARIIDASGTVRVFAHLAADPPRH